MKIYSNRYTTASLTAVIATLLLLGMAFAATDEKTATASVTVSTYVSITLTDAGTAGVNFGALDPGIDDTGDADQTSVLPAIKVTNDPVSNVDIKVNVKGTDFSDSVSNSFSVGQATYDDDNTPSESQETGKTETALLNTYPVTDYYTGISPGSDADFWFFIDILGNQDAATYSSIFTFEGSS